MKSLIFWKTLLLLLLLAPMADAKDRKKKKVPPPPTEQDQVYRLLSCLSHKDPYCYMNLFPDFDTISKLVLLYTEPSSPDHEDMAILQGSHPEKIMRADSFFRAKLKASFDWVIATGEKQNVHWESIVSLRYELHRIRKTRDSLYEKLAATRFEGYIFFVDGITRRVYGMRVNDIIQIQDEWYGGRMQAVYEAGTADEYEERRIYYRTHKLAPKDEDADEDSTKKAPRDDPENDPRSEQKTIVARKFYAGQLDNEIPIQLYVRYLKSCPDTVCAWEAIYKFGDQDEYIRLTVSKTPEGKWLFTEVPPAATIELTMDKKGNYTGGWESTDNKTGYDAVLHELPATNKKIEQLDAVFTELKRAHKKKKDADD